MALSQTAMQRLTMLADYMDGLHPRWPDKFDMSVWRKERPFCGTRACALGWGTTMPEFRAMGLRLTTEWPRGLVPTYQGKTHWEALALFFDIAPKQAETLFSGDLQQSVETPQEWATHCRTFIKLNQQEPEQFKTFMAKVQEPVRVE
jgi:hypothetical protein